MHPPINFVSGTIGTIECAHSWELTHRNDYKAATLSEATLLSLIPMLQVKMTVPTVDLASIVSTSLGAPPAPSDTNITSVAAVLEVSKPDINNSYNATDFGRLDVKP